MANLHLRRKVIATSAGVRRGRVYQVAKNGNYFKNDKLNET